MEDRFPDKCIPSGFSSNILDYYLDFCSDFTSSPKQFHVFVMLTIIGMLMGRMVRINSGMRGVFPNLYVLLLGEPSQYKTTAWEIGYDVLQEVHPEYLLPKEFSNERFKAYLAKLPQTDRNDTRGLFPLDELSTFLKLVKKQYADEIPGLLTNFYDCPKNHTVARQTGDFTINKPFLSVFATSTFDWYVKNIDESDIKGGHFPRYIHVPSWAREKEEERKRIQPPRDEMKYSKILDELRIMDERAKKRINMRLSDKAEHIYNQWDSRWFKESEAADPRLRAMYSKLPPITLKIAMILHFAHIGTDEIAPEMMESATTIMDWLLSSYQKMTVEFGFSDFERKKNVVLKLISEKGKDGIDRSQLLRHSHLPKKELVNIIETLEDSELVTVHRGRPERYTRFGG